MYVKSTPIPGRRDVLSIVTEVRAATAGLREGAQLHFHRAWDRNIGGRLFVRHTGVANLNPIAAMSPQTSILGRCPNCGESLEEHDVLISYERGSDTEYYAECPGCLDVVHPVRE